MGGVEIYQLVRYFFISVKRYWKSLNYAILYIIFYGSRKIFSPNPYDSHKIFPSILYGSRKILSFFTLIYFANKATGGQKK